MITPINNQAYVFLFIVLGGILIGLVYDLFRVSRKTIKTSNLMVYVQDLIFWILVSIIIFIVLLLSNAGEIRGYVLFATVIGVVLYELALSNLVMDSLLKILEILKKVIKSIYKTIIKPLLFIIRKIIYPFLYLYRFLKKIYKVLKKILLKVIDRIKVNIKNIKIIAKKH